ncbi:hypothetical protein L3X38_025172 [Prunus dulcis]|uniref:RNase H type-1 domain-containing protein n=1 Tax=Prunus dulcis TaxID=3755 RepID=A0AAD4W151_PRUDU|nr:hypothetical protein L3X38_025172 [Prunus dulcis]
MCVDYTNLNRAHPNDGFPLPRIDQFADATAGHTLLIFIDAYSGYNQIFMHLEDHGHTSFITDRGLYCYKALKGQKRAITWTTECDNAFTQLKEYMSKAPPLSTPEPGDILTIYLFVSAMAVSSVLIRPHEGAEHPMHYVSEALQDTKPQTSGKLVKCAIELGEFDIHYKPHSATKGQAVADFISEFTEPQASATPQILLEPTPTSTLVHIASNDNFNLRQPLWTLYVDGSPNAQGGRVGLVLISPDKVVLEYALLFKFHASNNVAEYEALLAGLRIAKKMGAKQIQIFSDS